MPAILFIHRSVGRNLINDGGVYRLINDAGRPFEFADFDQNTDLLQDTSGHHTVKWQFPGNDTTPADYAELFSHKSLQAGNPTLIAILKFDVIVIKSCYPNSNVKTQEALETLQYNYQATTSFFKLQPMKKLVIVTSPPLIPLKTNSANAYRARQVADWLAHNKFASNVFVYDLFDELAAAADEPQPNMLRKQFRRLLTFDAHPNKKASKIIAPKFVSFLQNIAEAR